MNAPDSPTPWYAPVVVLGIGILAAGVSFAMFIQLRSMALILTAAVLIYAGAGALAGALWPRHRGWWPAPIVAPPLLVLGGIVWSGSLVAQDLYAFLAATAGAVLGTFGGALLRRPRPAGAAANTDPGVPRA